MTRAMSTVEVNNLGAEPSLGIAPANQFGSSVHKIYGVGGHRILMRYKFHYNSSIEAGERDVQKAVRDHERSFQRRFPMLNGFEMEHRWGGRLCLSCNNVPVFGELEENLFAHVVKTDLVFPKELSQEFWLRSTLADYRIHTSKITSTKLNPRVCLRNLSPQSVLLPILTGRNTVPDLKNKGIHFAGFGR